MDDPLDLVLRALADRTRRALLDRLRDAPGLTQTELIEGFDVSRQALSKHLAMLEDAELVVPVWRGREKRHYLNPAPLHALPARWVTASPREERAAMAALQQALPTGMDGSDRPVPAVVAAADRRIEAAPDPIAALLVAAPAPSLQGQPVLRAEALDAARDYLAATARAVDEIVHAMPADRGYDRPPNGAFSLVEHLWHLADLESLGWGPRFERILAEARPRLPGVDGDRLAVEGRYQARPWRAAARRFVTARRRSLRLLARFDVEVLRRPVHFAGGRAKAGAVVAACVAHDLEHRQAMAERWRALHAGERDDAPQSRPETQRRQRRTP